MLQLAELRKNHSRLLNLTHGRKSDIESTMERLSQFHDNLEAATESIQSLVDVLASDMSQPVSDDVQSIQRSQEQFVVRSQL